MCVFLFFLLLSLANPIDLAHVDIPKDSTIRELLSVAGETDFRFRNYIHIIQ